MKGIKIKKGTIQDATFITSDPGHGNNKKKGETIKFLEPESKESKEEDKKKDDGRGEQAMTRRSRDGTWTKKNDKSYFGYKLHTIEDTEYYMIINYSVTTAKVHDSQVDLSIPGIPVYRDKGYYGVEPRGIGRTMERAKKGKKLSIES